MPAYYQDASERPVWLRRIFDDTARDYDRVEGWLSFGNGRRYRRQALLRAGLATGMHLADVGAGTGLVAREAIDIVGGGGRVVAIDPSEGMLGRAREVLGIEAVVGRAESLPFGNAEFDMVSMGYALRHVDDLLAAFREFARILKPGGRICILEITRPAGALSRALLRTHMALIFAAARLTPNIASRTPELWRYFRDTIERCVPAEQVLGSLRDAGFADAARHVSLRVLTEYTGTLA
jgi:demethylmenaquinone methyltransferase/2-methoxy-6-polyprenyl-1,4-benzoquinol methylase